MSDTLNVECLVQALTNYLDAKSEHDKARDNYDGYDWGYHGHYESAAMSHAAVALQQHLDEYIDAKIEARLGDKQ